MRMLYALAYVGFILREVVRGALVLVGYAFSPRLRSKPSIVEYPLRCRSDVEVAVFTSSITITPGTVVLALAGSEGDSPATLFVHSLFGGAREPVVDGLRDMEDRLLRATRGAS
jgi:multicomponent Na+:H+ antiporter subunit E